MYQLRHNNRTFPRCDTLDSIHRAAPGTESKEHRELGGIEIIGGQEGQKVVGVEKELGGIAEGWEGQQ